MSSGSLELGDVIRSLRAEITKAASVAEHEVLQFELGVIEIELNITAKSEGSSNGTIKFEVLGIGANVGGTGKISSEHIQKVKLTLSPHMSQPPPMKRESGRPSLHEIIHNAPISNVPKFEAVNLGYTEKK
jgi:hypothetical protein